MSPNIIQWTNEGGSRDCETDVSYPFIQKISSNALLLSNCEMKQKCQSSKSIKISTPNYVQAMLKMRKRCGKLGQMQEICLILMPAVYMFQIFVPLCCCHSDTNTEITVRTKQCRKNHVCLLPKNTIYM